MNKYTQENLLIGKWSNYVGNKYWKAFITIIECAINNTPADAEIVKTMYECFEKAMMEDYSKTKGGGIE